MLLLPPPRRPGKGDAFAVLGVSPEASQEEIKRAYLWLSRRYHPDVNPDGYDEFLRVNQAYQEAMRCGNYARLKLKCDVIESKAAHVEFLQLVLKTKALAGLEIPPVSAQTPDSGEGAEKAWQLGFALLFRCPLCRWKEECDRATGFGEVEAFHHEFMSKAAGR